MTAVALIRWMNGPGTIGKRQAAAQVSVAPFAHDNETMKGQDTSAEDAVDHAVS
ncbi:MAG: hypothetical protein OXF74_02225 [Rhodobacteraceae bacterium]|nr:hypothetical protein [Paracoccaceae bacterium]